MISYKKLFSPKGLIKLKKKTLFLENNTNSDNLANVSNETKKRNCIRSVQVKKINSSFWQSNFKTCKL